MPKMNEVAQELRRIADALDTQPELEIRQPSLSWYHWSADAKESFLNIAKVMPRPFEKVYGAEKLRIENKSPALWVYSEIVRSAACELVEPAKPAVYKCEPILSELDEREVSA